jgi:hypothetical protein
MRDALPPIRPSGRHIAASFVLFVFGCGGGEYGELPKGGDGGGDGAGLPAFALTGAQPDHGPEAGGTAVTLSGSGFTSSTEVTVGGAPCASLTILSSVEIACTTPAGAAGAANLQASRPEDGALSSVAFTYESGGTDGTDGSTDGGTDGTDGGSDGGTDGTDGGTDGTDGGTDSGTGGGTDGGTDSGTGGGTDGGTDSGTDGGTDGGTGGDTGVIVTPVDYCHIQYPCTMTSTAGAASSVVYVWVYQGGITVGAGQGAGVSVEVGVGPDASDPSAGGWTWSIGGYNGDKDGLTAGDLSNDEYQGSFTTPATLGSYDYCGRVSADGGASWTYCDSGGSSCGGSGSDDGYSAANAGQLSVN